MDAISIFFFLMHTLMIRNANALDLSSKGLAISITPFVLYLFPIHYSSLLSKNRPHEISEE